MYRIVAARLGIRSAKRRSSIAFSSFGDNKIAIRNFLLAFIGAARVPREPVTGTMGTPNLLCNKCVCLCGRRLDRFGETAQLDQQLRAALHASSILNACVSIGL